ncbi:MAG: AraC family transcriptional regulator [Pseudomonadota bacterium]
METPLFEIKLQTLSQLSQGDDWRLRLIHDRPFHMLIWFTRGQGRVLLDGTRRGIGAHNALFVPPRSLMAVELGRQSIGHAVLIPETTALRLPDMPHHLRIRDVDAQSELTSLIEAALREAQGSRNLRADAIEAHAALIAVWLRRQLMLEEHIPEPLRASGRLSQRFCRLIPNRFRSGDVMADYARTLGVTATHLTRAVKSATGKTAADLLTERLLYEARALLRETDAPAQNIAQYLGFGSPAYFTRFVQKHTGLPPSKHRNR